MIDKKNSLAVQFFKFHQLYQFELRGIKNIAAKRYLETFIVEQKRTFERKHLRWLRIGRSENYTGQQCIVLKKTRNKIGYLGEKI